MSSIVFAIMAHFKPSECNDARDDFSSQRRQAEKGGKTLFNMSSEEMNEMDTQACVSLVVSPIKRIENMKLSMMLVGAMLVGENS